MRFFVTLVVLLATVGLLLGCDDTPDSGPLVNSEGGESSPKQVTSQLSDQERVLTAANAQPRELEWEELIPEGFRLEALMEEAGIRFDEDLEDDDPRAQVLMDQIQNALNTAPSVDGLDGQLIRMPGFVVPLEWAKDGKHLTEFLLVPYYGACIHVPPPPANQTIHVVLAQPDTEERRAFDTVWVEGIIRTERSQSDLAASGYRVDALKVSTYSEETAQ